MKKATSSDNQLIEEAIGTKIKKQRLKCGLSQSDLASILGCSHQLIQKYECGQAKVQASALYILSNALNVLPSFFYEDINIQKDNIIPLPSKGDTIRRSSKRNWNILLVEDNPEDEFLFRKTVDNLLLNKEFNIETCYNGVDAISFLAQLEQRENLAIDFVFLDINLPKKDGLSLLKELKRNSKYTHIPILILSNSINAEEMLTSYKLHASGYILKTMDLNEFQHKLTQILSYWTEAVTTPKNY